MVNELREAKIQRCRGLILQLLRANKKISVGATDAAVDEVVLQRLLARFGYELTDDEMARDLRHLEGRNYIIRTRKESMGIELRYIVLDDYAEGLFKGELHDDTLLID